MTSKLNTGWSVLIYCTVYVVVLYQVSSQWPNECINNQQSELHYANPGSVTAISINHRTVQEVIQCGNGEIYKAVFRYKPYCRNVYWIATMLTINNGRVHRPFYQPIMVRKPTRRQLFYLLLILLCSGDIEVNPGPPKLNPSSSARITRQGTLTQGDEGQLTVSGNGSQLNSSDQQDSNYMVLLNEIRGMRTELNTKIDVMRNDLGTKIEQIKEENTKMKSQLKQLTDQNEDLLKRIDDLENRSRRNNVIVNGIEEDDNETWDNSERKFRQMLVNNLQMENDDASAVQIERVHRIGKAARGKTRPIIACLLSYKDKEYILKQARWCKPEGVFISEDFSKSVRTAREKMKSTLTEARRAGYKAFFRYDKLVVEDETGRQNLYKYTNKDKTLVTLKNTADFQPSK